MTKTLEDVRTLADAVRTEIAKAIVGQHDTIEHLLIALVSQGHVLLEGPPGTAKTLLAQCFAQTLGLDFGRIQFTPDLLPGDILGSESVQLPDQPVHPHPRPDLLRAAAGRRNQPHPAQDAGRAARSDAGAQGHARRRDPPAPEPLHGGRDPEPDREPGRLSAARSAARPLRVQAAGVLSERRGRGRRSCCRFGERSGPPHPEDFGMAKVADADDARRHRRGGEDP